MKSVAQEPLAVPPFGIRPISEAQFNCFRDLISQRVGIHLTAAKKALLVGRLGRRLHALGLDNFGAYFDRVSSDEAELVEMVNHVSTNETHFFREPAQFDFLERSVFPRWREERQQRLRSGQIRILSAGCSTGEEPFTIAMELDTHLPPAEGWSHEIIATDISTRVLSAAASATWPVQRATEIPASYLSRYMLKGKAENSGKMRAVPELRRLIRFERMNLKAVRFASLGHFDAIFCRNVLIYFDRPLKEQVVAGLVSCLKPGGYLFLGHAETLVGSRYDMRIVVPTVLQKRAE